MERAVLGKASKRTPYQHTRAVRQAVNKIAPRPEPEEPGSPEEERRAEVRDAGPWSTGLWMQGPTEQMAVIAARMAAATSVPKSPEDPRTFPHRRYDSIFDAVTANTSVFVDLVAYANPDGTISLPSLPGIEDLTPDQLAKPSTTPGTTPTNSQPGAGVSIAVNRPARRARHAAMTRGDDVRLMRPFASGDAGHRHHQPWDLRPWERPSRLPITAASTMTAMSGAKR